MTEQIEDDFWAEERARDTAARGRQADPGACGTCRGNVEAGGQVEHDGCAQRATLLQAPDHPGYELITGLSEEELAALPARFHVPAFVESSTPKAWVCAVCWGDAWSTQWPCKTALEQGLRVFTAEQIAENHALQQGRELAAYRALDLGLVDDRISATCENPEHPTWLRAKDDERGCPWCRVAALELAEGLARAAETDAKAELAKYVGAEPTIAEEMAYLGRCLDSVRDVCDEAVRQATRWENPLPVPEWVETVRAAASGERPDDPADNRRRIYIDGKGNGWISACSEEGVEYVVPVEPAAHVEQAVDEIAHETGSLREIGRCW